MFCGSFGLPYFVRKSVDRVSELDIGSLLCQGESIGKESK